jgi:hypothetical protein
MIRRHLVSLVAVCAALAVGVALGGGPLSDLGHADTGPSHPATRTATTDRHEIALDESFARAAGRALAAGRLSGQRVALVTLPGATATTVSALTADVQGAGGTVSSVVRIQPAALTPTRKTYADTLATQLATQLRGRGVDGSLPTYQRLGQVIGFSYAGESPAGALGADRSTAAQTLVAAKLVRTTGGTAPATLILLVVGPGARDRVDPSVLAPLVEGIGGATRRLVAAGDSASATHGELAALREQHWGPWFASVDGVETTVGQVTATLALARQTGRLGGAFGASGFSGLMTLR